MTQHSTATFWSSPAQSTVTRVLLIRHGRVSWNAKAVYTGWTDLPLDEQGQEEARILSTRMRDVSLAAVYSSDLQRARQTAEIIAHPHGLEVRAEPDLREINYGEWEGIDADDIHERFGSDVLDSWLADPVNYRIPGGETFGELRDRAAPAVDRIAARYPGQTVAIIAHRSVNRVLICHWLGLDVGRYKQIEQKNVAINSIAFHGDRAVLETVNDVCHMKP